MWETSYIRINICLHRNHYHHRLWSQQRHLFTCVWVCLYLGHVGIASSLHQGPAWLWCIHSAWERKAGFYKPKYTTWTVLLRHVDIISFMAHLSMETKPWACFHMCNRTRDLDALNLWYCQENPVLHRAQQIAVCMNNQILPFVSAHLHSAVYHKPEGRNIFLFLFLSASTYQFHTCLQAWGWGTVCVWACVGEMSLQRPIYAHKFPLWTPLAVNYCLQ